MAIEWIIGAPFIQDNTSGTTVTASGAINQSGMLYSVILPAASGVPTGAQVAAGTGDDDEAVAVGFSSNAEASDSGVYVELSGYGLTSETDYVMYVAASGYDDGLLSDASGLAFTTPDITAPVWSGVYPTISSFFATSGYVCLAIDEAGSGWALAVISGSAAPTVNAIQTSGVISALSANTVAYVTLTGLTSETDYAIYAVAQDDAATPNVQASGWFVNYATTTDNTPPAWISGYPALFSEFMPGDPTYSAFPTSGIYKLAIDRAGRGYALTLASGSAVPTAAAIKLSGNVVDMPTSGVAYYITKAGLTSNTAYTVYCVAEDTFTLNLQSSGTAFSFTTLDITPPTWGAGYPSGVSTTTTTATFALNVSENNSEAYYVAIPSGMAPSSAAHIKSTGTLVSLPASTGIYTCVVSGLNSDSAYGVQFVAEDSFNNLQSTGVIVYCLTDDNIVPTWSGSYPVASSIFSTSGIFSLAVDSDTCSGYALALPATSGAPTSSGVKASGFDVDMASAGTVYDVTVTGLVANTSYIAYLVAQDEYANLQPMPYAINFSTDISAPTWASDYPSVTSITTTSASANFKLNDVGSGYGVVVLSTASTPSAAQIIAGQDATGASVSDGFKPTTPLVANTAADADILGLVYSTNYKLCAVCVDAGGNQTSVSTVAFRAAVPKPGLPGRYSMRRITRDRQRLGNQILNTLRG